MSDHTISFIVPTLNRPSLAATLASIELWPGDELLVVGNVEAAEIGQRRYLPCPAGRDWGSAERNFAMPLARGTHLAFLDDDDTAAPGARAVMAQAIRETPERPIVFRMQYPDGRTLWTEPAIRFGNVGTPMFLIPNMPEKLGHWGGFIGGDCHFLETQRWFRHEIVWRSEVIALIGANTPAHAQHETTRLLRILLVHPGASWSTADVYDGLLWGLRRHAIVEPYRLDTRIEASAGALGHLWRTKKKREPTTPRPNEADVLYHAGVGALEMALREQVDIVLIVSAMFLHPDVIVMMKRAGLRVTVLFTESPYDHEKELAIARLVDGCWTNERTMVPAFRRVNPNAGYLAHAWHPLKHFVAQPETIEDVAAHDVVFVGSGFAERVTFFNSIDWTGIDLGLYGSWKSLGLKKQVAKCVRGAQITNETASALYRRAKVGLNLYRRFTAYGKKRRIDGAESLSPRAYELAACGSFHLSDYRAEVPELFGDLVPTFTTPHEAAALIRLWLAMPAERACVASQLPARVAEASWGNRAITVLGDLHRLLQQEAAGARRRSA